MDTHNGSASLEFLVAQYDKRAKEIAELENHLRALKAYHRQKSLEDFGIADGEVATARGVIECVMRLVREKGNY